ncbi:hypothetical protein B0H34DRAFT_792060 [Crassisporium funariophilum]|nr:hypothetical protein B0H34DRAFT_792060 [Crassisporium funariophilum]
MADFPQDEGYFDDISFHISPSSSVLGALCSINPPSPILSPSQLTFTWSSGDIPLVLFDDAYLLDARSPTPSGISRNRESYAYSLQSRRRSRVESVYDGPDLLGASGSSNTIASVGTFGPRHKVLKSPESRWSRASSLEECSTEDCIALDNDMQQSPAGRGNTRDSRNPYRISSQEIENLDHDRRPTITSRVTSPGRLVSEAVVVKPDVDSGVSDCHDSHLHRRHESNEPTPHIVQRRKSQREPTTPQQIQIPWVSFHEWNRQHGSQESMPDISPTKYIPDQQPKVIVTPPRRTILGNRDTNNHKMDMRAQAAEDFSWLKAVTVQFLVDQEGFRAAQPSFKYSGLVRLRSSQEPRMPATLMAQFRPTVRQAFHFHYAPFETPPILRRVTTNGQETHDYISKQAHLTLKSNGVYVLRGHEISTAEHDASEPTRLQWQFEYLVDNRRIDSASGRVIEGEKVFTPLNFSCSPKLLLPTQGKRINIMHVFKKGVAPKLVAEKLQPPGTRVASDFSTITSTKTDAHVSQLVIPKGTVWSLHRRVQSHGSRQPVAQTFAHRTRGKISVSPGSKPTRLRRSSSAGGNYQPPGVSRFIDAVPHTSQQQSVLGQHIIPPTRLAELFDVSSSNSPPPVPTSAGFVSLTPRPRMRHPS